MKKLVALFGFLLTFSAFSIGTPTSANSRWINVEGTPQQFVQSVQSVANKDFQIQQTKLDGIESNPSGGQQRSRSFKITGTLEYIRIYIFPYIQWTIFIGLSIGAVMLIWNGFKLVTQSVSGDKVAEIKKDIQSVLMGVVILTSFLAIIKLTLGLLNIFFS